MASGKRETSVRSKTGANLAGSLGDSLRHHAMERCRHFFLYLFFYKALSDRMNFRHGQNFTPTQGVSTAATHQIDKGMKNTGAKLKHYYGFDDGDPLIVDKSATACGEVDASHYCNLGIEAGYRNTVAQFAKKAVDEVAFDLYEALKVFCGNTKWLPKRVNTGPDRVIDALHGVLALQMLNNPKRPPISALNRAAYLAAARHDFREYIKKHRALGNLGLVACAQAYFRFYDDPEYVQEMWTTVTGNVTAECHAHWLTLDDYFKRTVA
jgi:hypothetical protein